MYRKLFSTSIFQTCETLDALSRKKHGRKTETFNNLQYVLPFWQHPCTNAFVHLNNSATNHIVGISLPYQVSMLVLYSNRSDVHNTT